jgi:hypothetical protein
MLAKRHNSIQMVYAKRYGLLAAALLVLLCAS